jgi:hypothetical protein
MEAVLDNLLAVLPPLVPVVQHIHVAPGLEAEPRLPHLPPHLHPPFLPGLRCRALPPVHHHVRRCRCDPNQFNKKSPTPRQETLRIGEPRHGTTPPCDQESSGELRCGPTYHELEPWNVAVVVLGISPAAFAAKVPACENQFYKGSRHNPDHAI